MNSNNQESTSVAHGFQSHIQQEAMSIMKNEYVAVNNENQQINSS